VPTPHHVVDAMVAKLLDSCPPRPNSIILDPGCGTGRFIDGVVRWCGRHGRALPRLLGIESDSRHLSEARRRVSHLDTVEILNEDFLAPRTDTFDYIVCNPPYVSITGLSESERSDYRERYSTATGRFDLYLLFFEQALRLLNPGGRLVFITPEKFIYVRTAGPLRRALASLHVEEIHFLDETTFGDLTTYPTITTLVNAAAQSQTRILLRDGTIRQIHLPADGSSWLPSINGSGPSELTHTLADVSRRISCGVATGADEIYVARTSDLPTGLKRYAFPTIAGREITVEKELAPAHSMLVPYAINGDLLPEEQLGEFGAYLRQPERRNRLLKRTCVPRKPWYAFHENPPLEDILKPKILCKDITSRPFFVVDSSSQIVPRHSVYYIVPNDASIIGDLCAYLNSAVAEAWLRARCQRAANSFLRLQSHVLRNMPVPTDFVTSSQPAWYEREPTPA
jgi:adenine-specific DNA-methyltransferase